MLVWRPPERSHVEPDIFTAARESVEAVYRYDYRNSEGSLADQLDTLTGDLRTRYETEAQRVRGHPEGEQSCVRTVQIRMVQVDGDWRISELTVLTTG